MGLLGEAREALSDSVNWMMDACLRRVEESPDYLDEVLISIYPDGNPETKVEVLAPEEVSEPEATPTFEQQGGAQVVTLTQHAANVASAEAAVAQAYEAVTTEGDEYDQKAA